ncbi:MAG: glycoside hydrolase family 5 protein [Clostridia bacterium]|nr:glycoside hydrolase family 5 protein [Clostridia bacterium]
MKTFRRIMAVVLSLIMVIAICPSVIFASSETLSDKITDMSDASLLSPDFVEQKLKIGYNFGNQFDGCIRQEGYTAKTLADFDSAEEHMDYWESLWTNAPITEEYVKTVKSYGITLVRLPVSWYDHLDANGVIDPNFLARVKRVVDMIIENDMYCIINIHHDGHNGYKGVKIVLDAEHRESTMAYMTDIWTQVGTYFKDYGTHLMFEAYNEPTDSSRSMSPNDTRQAEANIQLNNFIKVVRSLGGNNAQRFLVCPGYSGLATPKSDGLVDETVGDLSKLIGTKHQYFSGSAFDSSYSDSFIKNSGMGLIIDEIGSSGRIPDSDDGALGKDIRTKIDKIYGLSSCWWDNGQAPEYSLIDRATCTPVNYKTLSAYVGKEIEPATVDVNEINTIDTKPYIAKFCTEDVGVNGRKYVIIKSEKPITEFVARSSSMGKYYIKGVDDGWVSWYESDDDQTYYRLDTRYINSFSYLKWKGSQAIIPGATENTYWVSGNYSIENTLLRPCTVKIDGELNSVIKLGARYVFPYVDDDHFVAYTDGENFYDEGDFIEITGDLNLTTLYVDLSMQKGAAMRLNEQTGLRFYTNIDKNQISSLETLGATVEMGTIIAHKKNIKGYDVTLETPETVNGKLAYVTVPYDHNKGYYSDGSFSGMVGSIVSIKDTNANVNFIGRGYIKITKGDFTKTIYADYVDNNYLNHSRAVSFVAYSLREDVEVYESFVDFKDVIDHYADLYIDPIDPSDNDKF